MLAPDPVVPHSTVGLDGSGGASGSVAAEVAERASPGTHVTLRDADACLVAPTLREGGSRSRMDRAAKF